MCTLRISFRYTYVHVYTYMSALIVVTLILSETIIQVHIVILEQCNILYFFSRCGCLITLALDLHSHVLYTDRNLVSSALRGIRVVNIL